MSIAQVGACKTIAKGGVGESGSSEMLVHQATGQRMIVLRSTDSSLCPNTGAVGILIVNGSVVASGTLTQVGSILQYEVATNDQVVAIVYMIPLFNQIACIRLGELNVELTECDLVRDTPAGNSGPAVIYSECIQTSNWYAWNNLMPPKPDDFHIVGEVEVPNPGVDVCLHPRVPQGINKSIFLMDLILVQQPGIWTQQVTVKQVRFDQVLVNANYEQTQVFYANKLIAKVPVDNVS